MSVRSLLLPSLLALVLGAGAAGLVACGDDGDTAGLLRPADAEQLLSDLTAARDALAGGECTDAAQAVARVSSDAERLPSSVDDRLAERLREGIDALEQRITPDCEAQVQPETTPTITTTVPPPTTETTPTETETTPTETTPPAETEPPAQTEPPATTEPPAQTDPDGTGGVAPGAEGADG